MNTNQEHEIEEQDEIRDDAIIGKALIWSACLFVPVILIGSVIFYVMNQKTVEVIEDKSGESVLAKLRDTQAVEIPQIDWKDVTEEAGIRFVHCNGLSNDKLLPETMGGGVACFDFDQDGDIDIFFTNSCYWDEAKNDQEKPTCVLYENDGTGKFNDVTKQVGLEITGYGMGVAVGDFNGDRWPDLFLTFLGKNRLLKNVDGKSFVDATDEAGVAGKETDWSSSCGWFDANNDGRLDLVVCNYLDWSIQQDIELDSTLNGSTKAYARPDSFGGTFPYLYINDGAGHFTETAEAAGMHIKNAYTSVPVAKSLGLAFLDIDNDSNTDIFIANDTVQNMLFRNKGDGTFEEVGTQMGVAFDSSGRARGAMGVDVRFIRPDMQLATAIGNFANEPVSFFVRQNIAGVNMLTDEAMSTGIGPQTRLELTFGTLFVDYELDGRLDFITANGHLETDITQVQPNQSYRQSPHFFWNTGTVEADTTEFVSVPTDKISQGFSAPMVARGSAYADFDGDGDVDLLLAACGEPVRLLRNDQSSGNHWIHIQLKGDENNPDAYGATVELSVNGQSQKQWISPTRSYLSQVAPIAYFGLGGSDTIDWIKITWPNGNVQQIEEPNVDRKLVVEQQDS